MGVPVLSRYNAGESLKIGYTCEQRDGFHLHDDLCVVEAVGPDGAAVPEEERGAVVISNLVNRGTVLLRYDLGDYVALEDPP
jgi:phenylacetate-CoA ligase